MIDPHQFALMVSEDIKGKSDQITKDILRDPSNQARWRDNLIEIIKKVNTQITDLKTEIANLDRKYSSLDFLTSPTESLRGRLEKAERFRYHAEKRLAEVDRLLSAGEVSEDMKLASFFRSSIEEHMRLKKTSGTHDSIDESLWLSLSGKWTFGVQE